MHPPCSNISVIAYESDGLLVEQYAYTEGAVEPITKHNHEEYQFALSYDHEGEYTYRGEVHSIPAGHLSVVHSGEVHAPSDRTFLHKPAHFAMAHIHPKWFEAVAAEVLAVSAYQPFFAPILRKDAFLNQLFLQLSSVADKSSQLEQDVALWNFLSCLIGRYAQDRFEHKSHRSSRKSVLLARDYLRDRYAEDVSLEQLSQVAGISRYHLCRLFRKEMGVSVSVYQTQLRLTQARKLLAKGSTIAESAIATGFYDQSHFGKHFKRHTGATPAKYICQNIL